MSKFRQAMPPKGGYEPFPYLRVPQIAKATGNKLLGSIAVVNAIAVVVYVKYRKRHKAQMLENTEADIALEPFLRAENERAILKHLWLNRVEENELMKDVPGWVTGTWYGEKPFYNPTDRWNPLTEIDMWPHCHPKVSSDRKFAAVCNL